MAETLEILTDQNAERAKTLVESVAQTRHHLDELKSAADEVAQHAEQATNTAVTAVRSLTAVLEKLRVDWEAKQGQTQQKLQELREKIEASGTSFDQAVQQLVESATVTEGGGRHAAEGIASHLQTSADQIETLTQTVTDFHTRVGTAADQIDSHGEELHAAVEHVVEELKHKTEAGAKHLDEWRLKASQHSRTMADHLTDGSHTVTEQSERLTGAVSGKANTSADKLIERLSKSALGDIERSSHELTGTIEDLSGAVEEIENRFAKPIDQVLNKAQDVVQLFQTIKPILDQVKKVL